MKQETAQTAQSTISDYHNLHKKPIKKYHALQIRDTVTGRYRWAVVWCKNDGGMNYCFPTSYGMRAAVRLVNRLEKEHEEKQRIVAMARNSYTIGV